MRDLVLVLRNTKCHSVMTFRGETLVPQALAVEVRKWVDSAVVAAIGSGGCVTFSVTVHQAGAECDHEVTHA